MFQTFQEFFKGNNIRLFLKYDGEREKNMFTSMIVDLDNPEETLVKNTDDLYEAFLGQVKKRNINVSNETQGLLLKAFLTMNAELLRRYDEKLVVIFTVENKGELEYYLSICNNTTAKNKRSSNFNEITEFFELQDVLN